MCMLPLMNISGTCNIETTGLGAYSLCFCLGCSSLQEGGGPYVRVLLVPLPIALTIFCIKLRYHASSDACTKASITF